LVSRDVIEICHDIAAVQIPDKVAVYADLLPVAFPGIILFVYPYLVDQLAYGIPIQFFNVNALLKAFNHMFDVFGIVPNNSQLRFQLRQADLKLVLLRFILCAKLMLSVT